MNSQPLLEVRNLSRHFGAVKALENCSLLVRPGEVVALAGDNGAGKTTMIKTLSGVYPPSSGEILIEGRPVKFSSPRRRGNWVSRPSIRILRWRII